MATEMSDHHYAIIEWDCREQPNFLLIQAAVRRVFNGSQSPSLTLVDDTGSDQYALVVCSYPQTKAEAQKLYDERDPEEVDR